MSMSTPHPDSPQDSSKTTSTPSSFGPPAEPAPGQPMPSYAEGRPQPGGYPQQHPGSPRDGYPQQFPAPDGQQPPYGMTAPDPARKAAARKMLIWGAIWFFGGIVLTVVFVVGSRGTHMPIFWGASIYGIIQLVRGGIAMSKAHG